jgi:hypothetical protein
VTAEYHHIGDADFRADEIRGDLTAEGRGAQTGIARSAVDDAEARRLEERLPGNENTSRGRRPPTALGRVL